MGRRDIESADNVEVTTDAGKTYTPEVIGNDPRTDIALIKVEGGSDLCLIAPTRDCQP